MKTTRLEHTNSDAACALHVQTFFVMLQEFLFLFSRGGRLIVDLHTALIILAAFVCLACGGRDIAAAEPLPRGFEHTQRRAPRPAQHGGTPAEWQPLPAPDGGSVRILIPTEWGAWYAGTDGGIYRSDDDGMSWNRLALLPVRFNILRTLVPVSPNTILTCTDRGSFITRDAGSSWEPLPAGMKRIARDSSGVLCGLNEGSVLVSQDSGRSWSGPTLRASGVFARTVFFLHAPSREMIMALSRSTLYRSVDGGISWDSLHIPFSDRAGYDGGVLFGDGDNLCMAIRSNHSDQTWIYASRDLGRTWTEIHPPAEPDMTVMAYDARGGTLAVVTRQVRQCSATLHVSTDFGCT